MPKPSKALAAVLVAAILLCWVNLRSDPPWDNFVGEFTDEAQYSANVQYLLKTGRWQIDWLNNLWNTPLYQLTCLISAKLLGGGVAFPRLVAAAAATSCLLAVAWFCLRVWGAAHAAWAVALLALNPLFFALHRSFGPEVQAAAFLCAGYAFALRRTSKAMLLAGLLLALAVLSKLSAAYALPGVFLFLLIDEGTKGRRAALLRALATPLFLIGAAFVFYCITRSDAFRAHRDLQLSISAKALRLPPIQRYWWVYLGTRLLRAPGAWLPIAAIVPWLVRRLDVKPGSAPPDEDKQQANSAGDMDGRAAERLLLCWIVGILVMVLISPENADRRLVYAVFPLCMVVPGALKSPSDGQRPGWTRAGWLLFGSLAAYVSILAALSATCYARYWEHCSQHFGRDIHVSMTLVFILTGAVALAAMLASRRFSSGFRKGWLAVYLALGALSIGSVALRPSYTVLSASRKLSEYVRAGDAFLFWQVHGDHGFVLTLDTEAVPVMIPRWGDSDRSAIPGLYERRAMSATVYRRTPWDWRPLAGVPGAQAPIEEFRLELVPNPLGVCSHSIDVCIYARRDER